MKHEIRPHASQPHCYKCGSLEIVQICHHCTVAMCKAHLQPELPRPIRWIAQYQDYKGLGLNNSEAKSYGAHCDECLHFSFHMNKWLVGIIYAVATLFFLISFLPFEMPDWFLIPSRLLIVIVAFCFFPFWLRNKLTEFNHRPSIPVIGDIQKLAVEETINGSITLNEFGEYSSIMSSNSQLGKIIIDAKLNSLDRERVRRYHKRYPMVIQTSPLIHLGYLFFKGDASLRFTRNLTSFRNLRPHTIPVVDYLAKNFFLSGHNTNEGVSWQSVFDYRYFLRAKDKKSPLPIQMYPRIINHTNDQWALELTIQLAPNDKWNDLLSSKMTVEKLTFQSNGAWGDPKIVSGEAIWDKNPSCNDNVPKYEFEWKKFILDDQEQFPRREKIYVRFNGELNQEMLTSLKGKLNVSFGHAFSGLKDLTFFHPTGFPRSLISPARLKTTLLVDFDLDLQSLNFHKSYEATPIVTDRVGVVPNHAFVKTVSDQLTKKPCYVQQIIEYPTRTNFANAKQLERAWRIEGRQYDDIYPIDFQIVITGFEDYKDKGFPQTVCTQCELKVSALIDRKRGQSQVDRFVEEVAKILEDALDAHKPPRSGQTPTGVVPPPQPPIRSSPQAKLPSDKPVPPTGPIDPPRRMPPRKGPTA